MKKKDKPPEQKIAAYWGSAYCCDNCGRKLGHTQEVEREEKYKAGCCEFCGKFGNLTRFRFRPLPRKRYRTVAAGGGERARASKGETNHV